MLLLTISQTDQKSIVKERVEVYSQEKTWIVDNFRKTEAYGMKALKHLRQK